MTTLSESKQEPSKEQTMRRRVYIAGPISKGCLVANVNQATEAFIALAKAGFAPLCPHWSVYSKPASYSDSPFGGKTDRAWCEATAMGSDQMTHADWMGVDLPWVSVAEAVLRLPGESTGADQEVACAKDHGVPVFDTVAELLLWDWTKDA